MDAKEVCNLGLSKLGPIAISSLVPPRSPLEIKCANGYPHWKRTELTKRRWVFNRQFTVLTRDATGELQATADRPYAYALPSNSLRPIRDKTTEWMQRGRYIYSARSTLVLEHHIDVPETEFDPLFTEVLACRIAIECVEHATQSNVKQATVEKKYDDALDDAKRNNAYILGHEDLRVEEADDEWEQGRFGTGL